MATSDLPVTADLKLRVPLIGPGPSGHASSTDCHGHRSGLGRRLSSARAGASQAGDHPRSLRHDGFPRGVGHESAVLVVSTYGFDISALGVVREPGDRAFRRLATRVSAILVEGPHMASGRPEPGFPADRVQSCGSPRPSGRRIEPPVLPLDATPLARVRKADRKEGPRNRYSSLCEH